MTPITVRNWDSLVTDAKQCLRVVHNFRIKIAGLALDACEIIHGGGNHWKDFEGVKTLKKFAVDIDMNYKTLNNWILMKKNVIDHLPQEWIEELKPDSEICRRVQNRLTGAHGNTSNVRHIFKEEVSRTKSELRLFHLLKYLKHTNTILKNHGTSDFKKAELEKLYGMLLDATANVEEMLGIENRKII